MLGYKLVTFGGHCSNNTFVIVSLHTNQSVQSPSRPVQMVLVRWFGGVTERLRDCCFPRNDSPFGYGKNLTHRVKIDICNSTHHSSPAWPLEAVSLCVRRWSVVNRNLDVDIGLCAVTHTSSRDHEKARVFTTKGLFWAMFKITN